MRRHFTLQNEILWVKSVAIEQEGEIRTHGHFKPVNSRRFLNDCHEYIFHLTKDGHVPLDRLAIGVPYEDKTNVERWPGVRGDRRCRGNVWFVPYETIQNRDRDRPHSATFPLEIPKMCIQLHGLDRTRLVLDPFLGIGTTARACAQLGVDCVGFEIDPRYCEEACRAVGKDGRA